ncbi:cell division protein FtsN [Aggregatibacter actinomycetemcomitans]|uniref:cell division protein FtsN n=1 Tax=Aggregatibacter actinomycetemcomitans TaxID=714 RepID=UPI0001B9F859|nr:cell division protein FtsN [Aggregatibacter actinomycetemcomitans]AEW76748.1 cell division protein FtsN [Aggregatibacter actinomycetemcomitans ANH9381]ACX81835.1 cell division protein FtsN [Aggregatibacter actinomycetemcomitans D11S-1]AMQ92679.1 cell division protein FtsN [Aggregatibacter actinomycetemcomitans]KND83331.1 cell division protein FtsN [Aggregatibacter actinomycetemcomitans serotype b str. SCC1398]KOE54449.1 cell division protein FtsN [Aggregatibacter actinomycetemcomitans serot
MAQRDYAARNGAKKKKKQKKSNKPLLFVIAGVIVAAFAFGLYLLKEKAPEPVVQPVETTEKTQPKSVLPNRPEEVWSYIKALETRTVPIDDNPKSLDKNMRLTEEQRKILQAMEKEQKQAELAKTKAAEAQQQAAQQSGQFTAQQPPQQQPKPQPQVVEAKKATPPREEKKAEQTVKAESTKKPEPQPAPPQTPASNGGERKYGLQCGAFKNKGQAENLQARLAILGLPARVNESADWNRVVVGPAGDRNAAVKMQEKAKSVISCVVIGM